MRTRPQGAVTVWLLVSLITLVACVALALDLALVTYQTSQLQTACDAAALASAAELIDPSVLFPEGLARWLVTDPAVRPPVQVDREQRRAARRRAQFYAAQNQVGGRPLLLDHNPDNHLRGDMVLGWVDQPDRLASPLRVGSREYTVNSVTVRGSRTRQRGNPLTLWIGRKLGIAGIDLTGSARATLDRRICGFRPVNHARVPLLPIVVGGPAGLPNDWIRQATSPAVPYQNDRLAVDDRTGIAISGRDGIPELILEMRVDSDSRLLGNAQLVSRGSKDLDPLAWRQQCVAGWGRSEFAGWGGEVSTDGEGRLTMGRLSTLSNSALETIRQSLLEIRGEKRIWLLGEWAAGESFHVINFAAARVLECEPDPEADAGLRIVVQPCLLQTSTALVRAGAPLNPWIGKVVLTR